MRPTRTPDPNTIALESGNYILTTADNETEGSNGLPSISSPITIQGAGRRGHIDHAQRSEQFRILHVGSACALTLRGLTVSGGSGGTAPGGGIFNNGTLTVTDCVVANNESEVAGGGGVHSLGDFTSVSSRLEFNSAGSAAGGGIDSRSGKLTIPRAR
jgi:hypothetical protein